MPRGVEILQSMDGYLASIDQKLGVQLSDFRVPGASFFGGAQAGTGVTSLSAMQNLNYPQLTSMVGGIQPGVRYGKPQLPVPQLGSTAPGAASGLHQNWLQVMVQAFSPKALADLKNVGIGKSAVGGAAGAAGATGAAAGSVGFLDKIKEMFGKGQSAVAEAGSSALGGAASLLGAVPVVGQLALAGAAIAGFGKTLVEGVGKLQEWNRTLHDSNVAFAEFSGAMAMVEAQQEMRDVWLRREQGDRRAATAGRQAEAMSRLERATAPLEDRWANVKNALMANLVEKITPAVQKTAQVIESIFNLLPKSWGGGPPGATDVQMFHEYMIDNARDKLEGKDVPMRWRGR